MTEKIYQLKISLKKIRPPIWRRIWVSEGVSLPELHEIIQVVMGWENYHLHQFTANGRDYGVLDGDFLSDMESEEDVYLNQLMRREKTKMAYIYDFGDSWQHEILLEKILEAEEGQTYPVCLKGKRACPPEDCGGAWGYSELLEILDHPDDEEYDEKREWIREDFEPDTFSLERVNQQLKAL